MSDEDTIRELSSKYLEEKGQDKVTKYLANRNFTSAERCILDAVHSFWTKNVISEEEFNEVFYRLGGRT